MKYTLIDPRNQKVQTHGMGFQCLETLHLSTTTLNALQSMLGSKPVNVMKRLSALKEKIVQTLAQLPKVGYDLDWNDI